MLTIDGEVLVESNAILWYLAEGSPSLPEAPLARASVLRWLLFEQDAIAGTIASLRFRLDTGLLEEHYPVVAQRRQAGRRVLEQLDAHLSNRDFLATGGYSIADIAAYAYVHVAGEAGLELSDHPAVERWLVKVEAQPRFFNDLEPIPASARNRLDRSIYG